MYNFGLFLMGAMAVFAALAALVAIAVTLITSCGTWGMFGGILIAVFVIGALLALGGAIIDGWYY